MNSPIAFVLLDNPVEPNMAEIAGALRARHPELPVEVISDATSKNLDARSNSGLLRCGSVSVAVVMMPAAIPQDRSLWSRAAIQWPDARAVAEQHRAHLIVATIGENEKSSQARTVTAVVGALISAMPMCSAVVWWGKVVKPANLWLEMSRQSFAPFPNYPFTLWVDILPFKSEVAVGAITMGLAAFVGREIEFGASNLNLSTVFSKVLGLAVYLIEHGPILKDGDTFGEDECERLKIHRADSNRFQGVPVFLCSASLAA